MKNIGVLLFLLLCLSPSFAALGDYSFAYTLNTWQELNQGTVLGNESTDDEYFIHPDYPLGGSASAGTGFPIGFDLSFDGEVYDRFGVNANGWIGLGKSIYGAAAIDMRSSNESSPLTYTNPAHPHEDRLARISGFSRDLAAQAGSEIRFYTLGSAPQRILVIQWKAFRRKNLTGDSFNFQIRLHEEHSQISIVFGQMSSTAFTGGQLGLRAMPAAEATNFANRITTEGWDQSQAGTEAGNLAQLSPTNFPASGATFSWQAAACVQAEFSATPQSGYAPLNVQFTDHSIPGDYAIVSWAWDFGDGTSSALQNPNHTYNNPGIYDLSLTVTDSGGYSHSIVREGYITAYSHGASGQANIQMQGNDAIISWDPITTDEHGQSMQTSYYYLYFNGSADPEGEYYFLAPIAYPNTTYTHYGVGLGARHMFYRVIAVE